MTVALKVLWGIQLNVLQISRDKRLFSIIETTNYLNIFCYWKCLNRMMFVREVRKLENHQNVLLEELLYHIEFRKQVSSDILSYQKTHANYVKHAKMVIYVNLLSLCLWEREKERETERQRDRERERELQVWQISQALVLGSVTLQFNIIISIVLFLYYYHYILCWIRHYYYYIWNYSYCNLCYETCHSLMT